MMLGSSFGLARVKNEGFGVKGSKLGSVPSRHPLCRVVTASFCHESSPLCRVVTFVFLQRGATFQSGAVLVFWP